MARQKEPDKLAQDASAALAAGMSYGKWKAIYGTPVQPKERIRSEYEKICVFCGEEFVANRRNQIYCSPQCAKKVTYRNWKAKHRK